MGEFLIILVIIILAVLYFKKQNEGKEKMVKKKVIVSNSENAEKVKNGNSNLDTEDPLYDFLIARQEYNFTGNITYI